MPSTQSILTEKYLQEVFKHGEKDLIMIAIKGIYDHLLEKGYSKEQLKTGTEFLKAIIVNADSFYRKNISNHRYWRARGLPQNPADFSSDDTNILKTFLEALVERTFIMHPDADYRFSSYRIARYMADYPINNIVVPYNEWREKMDLIDKGSEDAGANLDF